jgi:hypothetical protein
MLHTDIPTRADLDRLLRSREPGSVSIYVPTTPVTVEADASRIELKNLAGAAISQLADAGHDKRAIASIADELAALDDDPDFWAHQAHSLAVFATPDHVTTFRLPNRLTSLVEVSDRFHVKPLLRAVTFPQAAFVLAIAGGSVRLLEISPDLPAYEVRVEDMPSDVASAVGKASIKDRSEAGRLQGAEGQKVRLAQYARQVDAAIRPILSGLDIPLILAATEPLDAIFRSVSSYAHLADTSIGGNPETTSDADLAAEARRILDDWYAADLASIRERFELRSSQGRASTDIVDVARAATFGAIDTVFVDMDEVVPGSVDEESGAVTFTGAGDASDYGVVDEIARRAFLTGARVLAVRRQDIPANGSVAAILRFPI